MQPGPTPVRHGLVQRLHALQRVGPLLGRRAQMLVQAPVALDPGGMVPLPQSRREVLADQRVGVDLLDPARGAQQRD